MKSFKVDDAWVVEFDDFEWFGVDDTARARLAIDARTAAKENKCQSVSVFSIADALFPVHHTGRKRVHTEQIDTGVAFVMTCTHHVEIPRDHWEGLDDAGQAKLMKRVLDIVEIKGRTNPGRYEIFVPKGDGTNQYLERGKLG